MIPERFYHAYHGLDPRDRGNALWRVSADIYIELSRMYPGEPFPPEELVLVGPERAPAAPQPARMLGIEVLVDRGLPPRSVRLDVDDPITRAIKRAEEQGLKHVTIMPRPKFEMPPLPPMPEVTVKALVRKWGRKFRRAA